MAISYNFQSPSNFPSYSGIDWGSIHVDESSPPGPWEPDPSVEPDLSERRDPRRNYTWLTSATTGTTIRSTDAQGSIGTIFQGELDSSVAVHSLSGKSKEKIKVDTKKLEIEKNKLKALLESRTMKNFIYSKEFIHSVFDNFYSYRLARAQKSLEEMTAYEELLATVEEQSKKGGAMKRSVQKLKQKLVGVGDPRQLREAVKIDQENRKSQIAKIEQQAKKLYSFSEFLKMIKNITGVASVGGFKEDKFGFYIITKKLEAGGKDIGSYLIRIPLWYQNFDKGEVFFENRPETAIKIANLDKIYDTREHFCIIHNNVCWGEFSDDIAQAYNDSDLIALINYTIIYLQSTATKRPYCQWEEWCKKAKNRSGVFYPFNKNFSDEILREFSEDFIRQSILAKRVKDKKRKKDKTAVKEDNPSVSPNAFNLFIGSDHFREVGRRFISNFASRIWEERIWHEYREPLMSESVTSEEKLVIMIRILSSIQYRSPNGNTLFDALLYNFHEVRENWCRMYENLHVLRVHFTQEDKDRMVNEYLLPKICRELLGWIADTENTRARQTIDQRIDDMRAGVSGREDIDSEVERQIEESARSLRRDQDNEERELRLREARDLERLNELSRREQQEILSRGREGRYGTTLSREALLQAMEEMRAPRVNIPGTPMMSQTYVQLLNNSEGSRPVYTGTSSVSSSGSASSTGPTASL